MTDASQPVCFELEVPEPWLLPEGDGQFYRHYVSSMVAALARIHATVRLRTVPYHCDFAPRRASPGSILLSYHSVGDAPNVWRIKESPLVSYFTFDRRGYSGWSEFSQSPDLWSRIQSFDIARAESIRATEAQRQKDLNLSKYPQPARKSEVLEPGYTLLALQVTEDTVQKLQYLDQVEVMFRLAELLQARSRVLVLKRHPLCRDARVAHALRQAVLSFGNVRWSTDSIVDLIEGANEVVVGNSGVGFEALMHRKRVLSFGRSDFDAVVERFETLDDLAGLLDRPSAVSADDATRFLGLYLTEFCFDVRDIGSVSSKLARAIDSYAIDTQPAAHPASELFAAYASAETARRALVHTRSLAETSIVHGSQAIDPAPMAHWPSDHHFALRNFVPPTQRVIGISRSTDVPPPPEDAD